MQRTATVIWLASAGAALAHPGHDAAIAEGAAHWFSTPSHWIVLALAALAATEIARRAVRALRRKRRDA